MKLCDLSTFERMNPSLSINVFEFNILPIFPDENEDCFKNQYIDIIYRSKNQDAVKFSRFTFIKRNEQISLLQYNLKTFKHEKL